MCLSTHIQAYKQIGKEYEINLPRGGGTASKGGEEIKAKILKIKH